jgi:hypothetical protein
MNVKADGVMPFLTHVPGKLQHNYKRELTITQGNATGTSLRRRDGNKKVVLALSLQRSTHLETYSLRLLRLNLTSYDFTTFLLS